MAKMLAMAVPAAGARFRAEERELTEPSAHEVRIRVAACGVCHSDALTVQGIVPGIEYPRVPGHEVVGRIDAVGSDIESWKVGERVGVGWFGGSCGYCDRCRRGELFACENITAVTGLTRDGGYATHMLAHVSAVARFPAELDEVESAPLLCAGITTFNALRHSGARPGELVAVQGIGGLGHLGIQFASQLGFRTVAVNRGRDKEEMARKLGAHDYIDSRADDPAAVLQKMGGARAILATVTDAAAMEAVIGGLGPNGTLMVIGAVGPMTVNPLFLLGKRAAIKGWYSGTAVDSEDTLRFSRLNDIHSMNEIFPLAEAQAAYDRMMSGKARFRVVLKTD
jgi:alcohol dehydrogenase